MKKKICKKCKKSCDIRYYTATDGLICANCLKHYWKCEHCEKRYYNTKIQTEIDGKTVCSHCSSLANKCNDCNAKTFKPLSKTVHGYSICEKCERDYGICNECGLLTYSSIWIDIEESEYCQVCTNALFNYCDDCDCYYKKGEVCGECGGQRNVIRNYSYKPAPIFYGEGSVYYGLEIEVDALNDRKGDAVAICNILNKPKELMYIKRDGSLNEDTGFEVVNHPMSYKECLKYLKNVSKLDNHICNTSDRYGIHIHVSRTAFIDKVHLSKILHFFAKNKEFIEQIAERSSNDYCMSEDGSRIKAKIDGEDKRRHDAVNLCNKDTVEFRIFRSTIDYDKLAKNLQFVVSIIEYCKQNDLLNITKEKYIKYLQETEFEELNNFIKQITCV